MSLSFKKTNPLCHLRRPRQIFEVPPKKKNKSHPAVGNNQKSKWIYRNPFRQTMGILSKNCDSIRTLLAIHSFKKKDNMFWKHPLRLSLKNINKKSIWKQKKQAISSQNPPLHIIKGFPSFPLFRKKKKNEMIQPQTRHRIVQLHLRRIQPKTFHPAAWPPTRTSEGKGRRSFQGGDVVSNPRPVLLYIHSWKLTWENSKSTIYLKMYFLLKMGDFPMSC